MAKGISIGVASDTRDFMSGIKSGVIEPLGDVEDTLKDVQKAGDKAGDELDKSFKDQQKQTEELGNKYKQLSRTIGEASKTSSREMTEDSKKASESMEEGYDEASESAKSNAISTAASFDGSFDSIAGGAQGLISEAFAGFGPAGVAAGAAAAAGIGLITTAIDGAGAESDAMKAQIGALTSQLIDAGDKGSLAIGDIATGLETVATTTDGTIQNINDLKKSAEKTGSSFKDLALSQAGDLTTTNRLLKNEQDAYQKLFDQTQKQAGGESKAQEAKLKAIGDEIGLTLTQKKTLEAAAKAQKEFNEVGGPDLALQSQDVQAYADAVQSAYQDAGADVDDYVKNGEFDLNGYQKAMEKSAADLVAYQGNMATAQALLAKGGHDKALGYLESLGTDAAPLIAAFIKAPASQQASLEKTWDTLGSAASTSFGTSLQSDLDATPTTKTVTVQVDTSQAKRDLAAFAQVAVPVTITGQTSAGKRVF